MPRLTAPEVREIFEMLAEGKWTHEQIAEDFGCGRTTITHISNGRYWRKLAPDGWRPAKPIVARGSRNGFSKLSEEEACEIYRLAHAGAWTLWQIAERYGVSASQVHLIKTRKEWAHLWNEKGKCDEQD